MQQASLSVPYTYSAIIQSYKICRIHSCHTRYPNKTYLSGMCVIIFGKKNALIAHANTPLHIYGTGESCGRQQQQQQQHIKYTQLQSRTLLKSDESRNVIQPSIIVFVRMILTFFLRLYIYIWQ